MSTATLVEQTAPTAQSAGQQKIYPKAGAFARMDSTGVEKVFLDSSSVVNANDLTMTYINFGGI